ncbi:zinc finger A20 and AN1 domain-containing stress-associated protein 8-like [Andrographis paniculata]|uniref:zinc finger A20 and AN1 domain-containing stress-associated protein 8-like n=1 Tax=Andrographis paniculata TaxID=175694 RepID=UPI0021E6DC58|nr:zinc finger A20 and AN1 domain-containing stress-associated protein 8-like [Andrographis paniculata]XP_051143766.1 zinc finger A20 and AN1 domain-containing stress-associated protein 8-like [Andrographis paniculata]
MDHNDMGCQTPPEAPILCINNCGFFGSPSNMNMCSKCYKDAMLKQQQAKLAASSIETIVNGSSSSCSENESAVAANGQTEAVEAKELDVQPINSSNPTEIVEPKKKEGPNRCSSCKKRVGLTGFKCRCGNLFCGTHRYSDKHDCPFDYHTAAQEAIAKANPVVKAEKLNKI